LALTTAQVTGGSGTDTFIAIENLTGSNYNDTLTGNTGNNILDGGLGNDTMIGGLGNDTYVVNTLSDVVRELAGQGTDLVQSAISYSLVDTDGTGAYGGNVENLQLTGTANINGTGNALNNTLTGNSGNNILNGGLGNDTLIGGLGNDTYVVNVLTDVVRELAGQGTDLIQSAITFSLVDTDGTGAYGGNVENLQLTGNAAINGTGNALNNILFANAGNNILNGGAGTDTVSYQYAGALVRANLALTTAQVTGGSGTDTLIAIENLTGSRYNDTLTGNSGSNILDGGLGNDTMIGGLGNDTYVVNVLTDVVTELAGQGTDLVQSAITYSLVDTDGAAANGGNVENLTLTGTANINGTGNTLNNTLTGNSGNNILNGGLGNDTLIGGTGSDTFLFSTALNAATNNDTITDFAHDTDKCWLENAVFTTLGVTGVLAADNFSATGTAADANDYILYNTTSGALLYDADGNGAGVAVQFATLTTKPTITATDFMVV
jgi:Ca2+-binding RTX toxin-like protein